MEGFLIIRRSHCSIVGYMLNGDIVVSSNCSCAIIFTFMFACCVDHCKLIVWSLKAFSLGNTCLLLGTCGTLQREYQEDQTFFVMAMHGAQFMCGGPYQNDLVSGRINLVELLGANFFYEEHQNQATLE